MKVFNFFMEQKQTEDVLVWLNNNRSLSSELQFVAHTIPYSREMIYTMNNFVKEVDLINNDETIYEDKEGADKFRIDFALSMARGFEDTLDTICKFSDDEFFRNISAEFMDGIIAYDDYLVALLEHYSSADDVREALDAKRIADEEALKSLLSD